MIKITISLLMILLGVSVSSQEIDTRKPITKEDYLQKSKNQKTTGWILLAGGTSVAIAGVIIGGNDTGDSDDIFGPNFGTSAGLLIGGLAADLLSIPFFIGSSNNARKAATFSFNQQKIMYPGHNNFAVKTQAAISLTIRL
ncbi:MAG: hypothetical protein ACM3H8_12090 [Sphingobacteriales bacterium]